MADGLVTSTNGSGPGPQTAHTAPATVSARRHLRSGVPDIFRRDARAMVDQPPPFAMRFLQGLEEVLDPIAATLDSLPAHIHADLAPEHALAGVAAWLGVDEVESLPAEQRREAVRRAGELGRLRGTRPGLELALHLFFPDVDLRVNDHGGVIVAIDADADPPPSGAASFEVICDQSLPPETQMAVARCIERWKPAHARYKLRVRRGDRVKTLPEIPKATDDAQVTPAELRPPFDDDQPPPSADSDDAPEDDTDAG